jgi:hypothetical protein
VAVGVFVAVGGAVVVGVALGMRVFVAEGVAGAVTVALGRGVAAGGEAMALTGVLKCVTAGAAP